MALAAVAARVYATLHGLITDPLSTARAIPNNWYRQVLCLDFLHPPELVPGLEQQGKGPSFLSFIRGHEWRKPAHWFIAFLVVPIIFTPPFLYRLSFKISAFFWLPLLWIVSPLQPGSASSGDKLDDLRHGMVSKLALAWSVIAIVAFLVVLHVGAVRNWISNEVVQTAFPWQFASFVNGVLAVALFLFADTQLRRLSRNQALPEPALAHVIAWWILVRRALALYTLVCAIPLVLLWAKLLGHVDPGWRLFPQGLF